MKINVDIPNPTRQLLGQLKPGEVGYLRDQDKLFICGVDTNNLPQIIALHENPQPEDCTDLNNVNTTRRGTNEIIHNA